MPGYVAILSVIVSNFFTYAYFTILHPWLYLFFMNVHIFANVQFYWARLIFQLFFVFYSADYYFTWLMTVSKLFRVVPIYLLLSFTRNISATESLLMTALFHYGILLTLPVLIIAEPIYWRPLHYERMR